jgi:hypothetical protein
MPSRRQEAMILLLQSIAQRAGSQNLKIVLHIWLPILTGYCKDGLQQIPWPALYGHVCSDLRWRLFHNIDPGLDNAVNRMSKVRKLVGKASQHWHCTEGNNSEVELDIWTAGRKLNTRWKAWLRSD